MTIPVTIYTLPNCVQCNQTKRLMDQYGINYTVIDLETVPEKAAEFREQGHLTAPIVTTDIKVWSGFRLTKIKSLADHLKSEAKTAPVAAEPVATETALPPHLDENWVKAQADMLGALKLARKTGYYEGVEDEKARARANKTCKCGDH